MDSKNNLPSKDRQAKLLKAIEQGSDEVIISMLIDLKEHGETFYLEMLMRMAIGNRSDILKKAIVEFISNIKANAATPIIANFIQKNKNDNNIIALVTASWQSILDFSKHLNPFFSILIESDYLCSFEAFTVIENNISELTTEEISNYIAQLKLGISKTNSDKEPLLLEMASLLDETKRAAQ